MPPKIKRPTQVTCTVIASPHPKKIGHNEKMTIPTKLVISTTKEEKSLCEVADFSQKVEMTGSNKVRHCERSEANSPHCTCPPLAGTD